MFEFITEFDDKIPGCNPRECGNSKEHDLLLAKKEAKQFLKKILLCADEKNLNYSK